VSQENVELVRRMLAATDTDDVAKHLAPLLAPDYRIENIVTAVTDKTYHGVPGCLEWMRDMSDAFAPGARYELEAVIADTDELVVTRMAFVGTGAHSGAELRLRWITVTWCDAQRIYRSVGYANRHQALKAVGLAE
jgi:ketosteroid isomerase-like protein